MWKRAQFLTHLRILSSLAAASAALLAGAVVAQAAQYTTTRYVHINHMDHSAIIYDENFVPLPDSPMIPDTSYECYSPFESRWFIGLEADMVTRDPGTGQVSLASNIPDYVEMNHHFVMGFTQTDRDTTDVCNVNRPIAIGSELTDFDFPAGYGFQMQGGCLGGGTWHWANPAGVSMMDEVYIRLILHWDDATSGYTDTNVSWIDVNPCISGTCVQSGVQTITGPDYPMATAGQAVMVVPHVHDHATGIELQQNGAAMAQFTPANSLTWPVEHDDCGNGTTPWHTHSAGDTGHLSPDGLTAWSPGAAGPVFAPGDTLRAVGHFDNPHANAGGPPKSQSQPIDNMVIFVVFWALL